LECAHASGIKNFTLPTNVFQPVLRDDYQSQVKLQFSSGTPLGKSTKEETFVAQYVVIKNEVVILLILYGKINF
jgi:hypothetical protein